MKESENQLIQELVSKHRPRPWWKNPAILFLVWFILHAIYFISLGLVKSDVLQLRSSVLYVSFILIGIFLSGVFFIYTCRYTDLKVSWLKVWVTALILLLGLALFLESRVMGTVLYTRAMSITPGDINCFWHASITSLGPILLFPFIFKQFFVTQPKWAITFMSLHLALMGNLLNELKCPDRELWHLLLGHQTTFFGVAFILILATYLGRKLIFLKV